MDSEGYWSVYRRVGYRRVLVLGWVPAAALVMGSGAGVRIGVW